MKALVINNYGSPAKVLKLTDVDRPEPKSKEILIRIKASAINDFDYGLVSGEPKVYRLLFGINKPKYPILGLELAGTVEEVGAGVSKFKVGDHVLGDYPKADLVLLPNSFVWMKIL